MSKGFYLHRSHRECKHNQNKFDIWNYDLVYVIMTWYMSLWPDIYPCLDATVMIVLKIRLSNAYRSTLSSVELTLFNADILYRKIFWGYFYWGYFEDMNFDVMIFCAGRPRHLLLSVTSSKKSNATTTHRPLSTQHNTISCHYLHLHYS